MLGIIGILNNKKIITVDKTQVLTFLSLVENYFYERAWLNE